MKEMSEVAMVLILGMHRSGTSCLAGMLKTYGLNLGTDIQSQNNFNRKGNQEHLPSRDVNHQLILLNGGSWYHPKAIVHVPEELKTKAEQIKLAFRSEGKAFGIKDPRMIFCLDVWRDPSTHLVGTIRHPDLVAASLKRRNDHRAKKVEADWFETWYAYNAELLRRHEASPFPLVNFDWPEDKYRHAVQNLARHMGLEGEDSFFDLNLKNEQLEAVSAPEKCLRLYDRLNELANHFAR